MHASPLPHLAALALACAACAAPPPAEVAPPPGTAAPSGARLPAPKSRADELANAPVYDAEGHASTCAPPQHACPEMKPDVTGFTDRCRLAGFQVRQCGCFEFCSGDVAAATRHYDAAGAPRACAPARPDCTPPPAGAAFQDACSEKGYRLDVCGCEWLCSGNPKK